MENWRCTPTKKAHQRDTTIRGGNRTNTYYADYAKSPSFSCALCCSRNIDPASVPRYIRKSWRGNSTRKSLKPFASTYLLVLEVLIGVLARSCILRLAWHLSEFLIGVRRRCGWFMVSLWKLRGRRVDEYIMKIISMLCWKVTIKFRMRNDFCTGKCGWNIFIGY